MWREAHINYNNYSLCPMKSKLFRGEAIEKKLFRCPPEKVTDLLFL